jgi:hypothetical protein
VKRALEAGIQIINNPPPHALSLLKCTDMTAEVSVGFRLTANLGKMSNGD